MTDPSTSHDDDAEGIVLACLMETHDPAIFDAVVEVVTSESFYRPEHGVIYREIIAAYGTGQPTGPVAIASAMDPKILLRIGGAPYLHTLVEKLPTVAQAPHYARIVARHFRARRHAEVSIRVRDLGALEGDRLAERTAAILDELADLAGLPSGAAAGPTLGPVPTYPTSALVGPLRALVDASGGLPDALIAGAGLAAAAAAVPTAELEIGETMVEVPALWVPLIAPRGAGKTPSMDIAFRPIRDADTEAYQLYREALDTWQSTPRKDRDPQPPRDWTRLVGDLTLEKLARRLDVSDGAAVIASDELTLILGALGEYKGGSGGDRARMLALWPAQPWRYQRVGDGVDILIPRPVVTIVGGIQPPLHHRLGNEEDGMRPRWLPHVAALDAVAQDAGGMATTARRWAEVLGKLCGNTKARAWTLDGRAYEQWREARRRWKAASGGGETASTSAALVKADIQAARVALVLAETLEPGRGGSLPPEAMASAVSIVDYAMDCWRSLPEQSGPGLSRRAEVQDGRVERLRGWLEDRAGRQATRAELLKSQVAGVKVADELDELLARYAATYPGTVSRHRSGAKGGRPSTIVSAPSRATESGR